MRGLLSRGRGIPSGERVGPLSGLGPEDLQHRPLRLLQSEFIVAEGRVDIEVWWFAIHRVKAFNSPRGLLNGVPFQMLFFIATVMILAAMGDVRIMRFGMPHGRPRWFTYACRPQVSPKPVPLS